MAGTNLLTLIDDVATLLDDVATMTKIATKRTAGILGDDLAVNAQQVTGVAADRELPVVWAVARGSAVNKAILVPAALLLSALASWAITPLLMIGGAYLCFEGMEKVFHTLFDASSDRHEHHRALLDAVTHRSVNIIEIERTKIKGAVRTDFILSAEIIVIALGAIVDVDLVTRVITLLAVATIMTVGVYGLVAAIVKLDDVGLHLSRQTPGAAAAGRAIIMAAPWLMRGLGVAGTVAMLLVGGGIIRHGLPLLDGVLHSVLPHRSIIGSATEIVVNGVIGIGVGVLLLGVVKAVAGIGSEWKRKPEPVAGTRREQKR